MRNGSITVEQGELLPLSSLAAYLGKLRSYATTLVVRTSTKGMRRDLPENTAKGPN